MPGTEEEKDIGIDLIGLMGDVSDTLEVGDKEVHLYPLSLGKMQLLSKHEKAVAELINFVRETQEADDKEAAEKLAKAIESAIEIFHILTAPNDGNEPQAMTKEQKAELKWKLSMANVFQMMMYLRMGNIPTQYLKNVRGLKGVGAKETSANG